MSRNRIGVLIIPGTMGSVLKKEGKKIWPRHLGSKRHYIKNLTPITNSVEPSHLLFTYNRLKSDLSSKFDIVKEFVYDWRLNNLEHSSLLKSTIASMDVDEIHIVAHSMGGIIAKICLNENADDDDLKKVKKLITLGTPWKGSMDSVKTLLYGSRIPEKYLKYIEKDASKEISAHFPSVYQLLPSDDFLRELKAVNCVPYFLNGYYYDKFNDFFQGVLQEKFSELHSYENVFNTFFELLNKDLPDNIEFHEIIGTGKPTIKMICENTRKEPYVNYDEGDGTVPLLSAFSNLQGRSNYFPYFVNKATHNGLPGNRNIISLVKDIILGVEFTPNETIFNDLNSPSYKKFTGYISKVACPVEISIRDKEGNIIYGNIETINDEEIRELLLTNYEVESIGTTTYVIFDENNDTNIKNFNGLVIDAFDEGLTSISLEKYENGKVTKRKAFKTFEINPHLQAEIILEDETDDSSLVITKNGVVKQTLQLDNILVDEGKVNPPTTVIRFIGDNVFQIPNENIFFGKDLIKLNIDKIIPGDFEPKQSFIVINEKEYIIEGNSFDLSKEVLKHGENTIEYFSIDEYDYSETKNKIVFYYFHQITSKAKFTFKDKLYFVELSEDSFYSRIVFQYKLQRIPPSYQFNNQEGVTGYQVVYNDLERGLEITYTDIFGNISSLEFLIDEKTAKRIIKGAATVSDVEKFINNLKLEHVNYQFHLNKMGNHKLLNDNNLNGSFSFEIFSDSCNITFEKNVDLDVSFETLSEHISVTTEADDYTFVFKVLDIDQQYVSDLNLTGQITITVDPGHGKVNKEFKENFDVEYIPSSGSYKLLLSLKGIKELLDDYWRPQDKVLSTAKLEIINTKNNSIIRGLDIKIAK